MTGYALTTAIRYRKEIPFWPDDTVWSRAYPGSDSQGIESYDSWSDNLVTTAGFGWMSGYNTKYHWDWQGWFVWTVDEDLDEEWSYPSGGTGQTYTYLGA